MEADVQQLTVAVKELIDLVKDIAVEQATVDHSGLAWGTDMLNKLCEIEKRLPNHGGQHLINASPSNTNNNRSR